MGIASAWRNDALNDMLSKPAFAPVAPKKRAPRPSKYSEESVAASDAAGVIPTMHGNKSAHAKKTAGDPAPWNPVKSPTLRDHGYTMTSHDLQPGMTVIQWPTESSRTIGSVNHLTQDGTQLNYTDGGEEMVGRNASFAQGIPHQQ